MTADLPANGSARLERARADFIKGVVRPDAPGMVYYPSIPELAETYELVESVVSRAAREDGWLDARRDAQNTSLVTPYSVATDLDPNILRRSEIVAREMEKFDDKVFSLADRAMIIADKAMTELEHEDDPMKAIRALASLAKTMESFHRTAKTAYDPASIRPDNTINILNVPPPTSDEMIGKVAEILAKVKQDAISAGVDEASIEEAEIVEDEEQA